MNPLGYIQIGAYSLNGIMIYVYISVPVIVYSIMFLVRFPKYVHENFIKIVYSLYPQGAWLDVQRNLSQYFSSDGEYAYFTMTVYIFPSLLYESLMCLTMISCDSVLFQQFFFIPLSVLNQKY